MMDDASVRACLPRDAPRNLIERIETGVKNWNKIERKRKRDQTGRWDERTDRQTNGRTDHSFASPFWIGNYLHY